MAARDYPRLDIYEFGEHLLDSGDLDPVYIALNKMEWDSEDHLFRWLIAYWCFYHCGAASYLSEFPADNFWHRMRIAAINAQEAPPGGRWPRGSERRHFRGEQGVSAIEQMAAAFPDPSDIITMIAAREVDSMQPLKPVPFADIAARVQRLPRFGPWISFKVADMLDRLGICPVDFDKASVFMFKDPVKAALMLWRQHEKLPDNAQPRDRAAQELIIDNVVSHLTERFSGYTAPPLHERPVGLQEVETILCKYKSHVNGHYPLYNDIDEIRDGLAPWAPHSETARAMLQAMPQPEGE